MSARAGPATRPAKRNSGAAPYYRWVTDGPVLPALSKWARPGSNARETAMTIYTVEVGGRPVATMQSTSLGEAEEFLRSDAFLNDLTMYEMKGGEPGEPIWDGEAEVLVRESSPDEVAVWERIRAKAVRDGDTDPDDENFLTYLRGVREIE
jgi:hypothetical protein